MTNISYMHSFVMGLFVALALSPHLYLTIAIGILLILRWRNFILPISAALLIDITLSTHNSIYNLYGYILTMSTLLSTIILLKLRKLLKF